RLGIDTTSDLLFLSQQMSCGTYALPLERLSLVFEQTQQNRRMKAHCRIHFVLSWLVLNTALPTHAAPPAIEFQPKDQAVMLFQQTAFGVIPSGTAPLTYEWRKDGVPIAGAT